MAGDSGGPVQAITPAPPDSLRQIAIRVDGRMRRLLDAEVERWAAVDADLVDPFEALRTLVLSGGKRLRPAFCHWAFVGAGGGADDPAMVDAGAALELLHTFAIVHDDIMDGSLTRRGLDTLHLLFEERHTLGAWRGEGRRFGEGVAILVGDLCFVYADQLLGDAPRAALDVFNELRIEVNVGQYLDLLGAVRGDADRESARRICRYKSGKYTVERPLHLGAALAGRLDELGPALSAYGLPLGEAFQLRDDLLGALGDTAATGKPVGEDLREGKPTVLAAIAAERAGPDHPLLARLGQPDLDDGEVAELQALLVDTGAVAELERIIQTLVAEAVGAVDRAALTGEARTALTELAHYVAGRDH